MADEKQTEAPKAEAIDDKTLGERISAFLSNKFGASADDKPLAAQPTPDTKAIEDARAEAAAAKKEAAEANGRIAQLEKDARATRFGAIVKDWPGESAKHVAMLELLATSQEGGETSQAFTDYVTQQKAISEQVKTAALFQEVGSSQPVEGSVEATMESKIKALRDKDPALTYEGAYDQVWKAMSAHERTQYRDETRKSVN